MNDENSRSSLVAAHHTRIRALLDGDLETLATVVSEDLIFVSAFGAMQTRPEVFAAIESGALKIERMASRELATRLYGDIGILIYRADTKVVDGAVTFEGMTRSTTVYARQGGGWKLISQHQSRIE